MKTMSLHTVVLYNSSLFGIFRNQLKNSLSNLGSRGLKSCAAVQLGEHNRTAKHATETADKYRNPIIWSTVMQLW